MAKHFQVIVVGGGHAGCEAALAAARMGQKTALITPLVDRIAAMSCNPAIGGTAKGHLVKEIDALGGEMGKVIDKTGIQFRVLNRKKGPAIWSSRAQADMDYYSREMRFRVESQTNLHVRQDRVTALLTEDSLGSDVNVCGVVTELRGSITADTVILTTGTFLNGLIHVGDNKSTGGRSGESASIGLADFLKNTDSESAGLKLVLPPN